MKAGKTPLRKYLVALFVGFLFVWGCEETCRRVIGGFAGSYPFVETWTIDARQEEIAAAITELKKEQPDLQPPEERKRLTDTALSPDALDYYLKDTTAADQQQNASTDYWLHIDFYYNDTKEVVRTWLRPTEDSSQTVFAFVGLYSESFPMEFKLINKDFWYLANKKQIQKFRTRILEQVKLQVEKRTGRTAL